MNSIEIRDMLPEDAAQVSQLTRELGYEMPVTAMRERIANLSGDGVVLVAVADRDVVGWIHGLDRELLIYPRILEVGGLVVTEERRGSGVGKALLDALITRAREYGHTRVFVRSSIVRDGAHRFYERFGFEREKTSHTFSLEIG